MRLPRTVADQLADRVLIQAAHQGALPPSPPVDWRRYHEFHDLVDRGFHVPETSITPVMARVLYGIAARAQPPRLLVAGVYAGNAMVWLIGPGFGPWPLYCGMSALGVDVDEQAVALACANFAALDGDRRIAILQADARTVHPELGGPWDLIFLDAEDPVAGKAIYSELLEVYLPRLRPGGLVLAHDICVPKFKRQLTRYRNAVRDPVRFERSIALEIDSCGLELSVKRAVAASRTPDSAPT